MNNELMLLMLSFPELLNDSPVFVKIKVRDEYAFGVRGSRRLFDLVANKLIVSLTVYGCELEEWYKLLCNVFGLCLEGVRLVNKLQAYGFHRRRKKGGLCVDA